MTHRADRRDNLPHLIFDMEMGVKSLVGFSLLIRDLGTSEGEVSADALFAVGEVMVEQARAVHEEWLLLFEMSKAAREAGKCA